MDGIRVVVITGWGREEDLSHFVDIIEDRPSEWAAMEWMVIIIEHHKIMVWVMVPINLLLLRGDREEGGGRRSGG